MKIGEAKAITGGGISFTNGKMPGASYALPASACKVGVALVKVAGTVCSKCYVMRGNYLFDGPQLSMARHLASISNPQWVDAMVTLINSRLKPRRVRLVTHSWDFVNHCKLPNGRRWTSKSTRYFRWHDSGDIQSVEHLEKIAEIARRCPRVKFWLPTREYALVKIWSTSHACPSNLVIRLSAHLVDGPHPLILARELGVGTSGVHKRDSGYGKICTARERGNACGPCRACWSSKIESISYHAH